jgi:hypothetical protein
VRRKFFDVHAATGSPIAKEALDRIGQLYAVEKIINGSPPERRRQLRQLQSKPIAEALAAWAEQTSRLLSRKSELAQAFRYMRARWTALVRCFDDGRLALDNNPAERALRCVAIGRKNYLFAGSDAGGRRAAALYSLIESAKLNGLNPQHYLADVLARIADHPARRIAELPALELATARRHLRRRLSRPAHRTLTRHLSYSCAPQITHTALVTHDPKRTSVTHLFGCEMPQVRRLAGHLDRDFSGQRSRHRPRVHVKDFAGHEAGPSR